MDHKGRIENAVGGKPEKLNYNALIVTNIFLCLAKLEKLTHPQSEALHTLVGTFEIDRWYNL